MTEHPIPQRSTAVVAFLRGLVDKPVTFVFEAKTRDGVLKAVDEVGVVIEFERRVVAVPYTALSSIRAKD